MIGVINIVDGRMCYFKVGGSIFMEFKMGVIEVFIRRIYLGIFRK